MGIDLNQLIFPDWIRLPGSFIFSFFITYYSIPTIVKISNAKNLFVHTNERTSHVGNTPNLGGLAVFASIAITGIIASDYSVSNLIKFIAAGLILILMIGLKDDILIIDPKKKFLGQVLASLIIIWPGMLRISDFNNILGIESVSPFVSIVFTLLVFLIIINGFNLIDGVDGLSSGTGIIAASLYSGWFILIGNFEGAVLSLALMGSLIAFFRFNVFSRKNKIFLGDSGSMLIGIMISILTVTFIESDVPTTISGKFSSIPALAVSIVIVPVFDTVRVFILRLWNGKSPFLGDRNHIHHLLLGLGHSHLRVTLTILSFNLAIILLVVALQFTGDVTLLILQFLVSLLLSGLAAFLSSEKSKRANKNLV